MPASLIGGKQGCGVVDKSPMLKLGVQISSCVKQGLGCESFTEVPTDRGVGHAISPRN